MMSISFLIPMSISNKICKSSLALQTSFFAVMRNASTTHKKDLESLLNSYRKAAGMQEKELILSKI